MKKILGIGNALVDVLVKIEGDDFLDQFQLEKGSMTLIDEKKMHAIMEKINDFTTSKSSGGSGANTVHGIAKLGAPAGYIGKIGNDEFGAFFSSYMNQDNIGVSLFTGKKETGKSFVFISPDSERTFATFLGAAVELEPWDLHIDLFKGYDYFHLEGYLVQNHDLVLKAVELANEAGTKTAIDLASFNVVEANLEFLRGVVDSYVDIVFANEEEAKSFTGKETAEEALLDISNCCDIAVVKIGKEGSWVRSGNSQFRIPSINANAIDTTGAGDLYASGFFYGLATGQPLDICGKIGSATSGKIVEVIGAKMDDDKWNEVRQLIR